MHPVMSQGLVNREPPHCPTRCFRVEHGHFSIPSSVAIRDLPNMLQQASLDLHSLHLYWPVELSEDSFYMRDSRSPF